MGPKVAEFEDALAAACEVAARGRGLVGHGRASSRGAGARASARATRCSCPAYTFPATANVVALAGAQPVLVDVDPETMNIDPALVARGGDAADDGDPRRPPLRPARSRAERAARAAADRGRGRRARRAPAAARRAAASACSAASRFHPRKIVTTGEGGAVTTNDERVADVGAAAAPPRLAPSADRHAGSGSQLPARRRALRDRDPAAARGSSELLAARERVAAGYEERLRGPAGRCCPRADEGDRHGLAGLRDPGRPPRRGDGRPARAGDRGADRDLRAAPARARTATRGRSRAPTRVRAGARVAVPLAAHRLGSRPCRRSLDNSSK